MQVSGHPLPIIEVAFGSIGAAYTANQITFASGNEKSCIQLLARNDTDAAVYLTFDGSTNHIYLAAGDAIVLDFQDLGHLDVKLVSGAPTTGSFRATIFHE